MKTTTQKNGRFNVSGLEKQNYVILIFFDNNSTPGVDYLPSLIEISSTERKDVVIILEPAASIHLDGDIQFFESEELPRITSYCILDIENSSVLSLTGFKLVFSSRQSNYSDLLGLEEAHLIVPANLPVKIGVNSTISISSGNRRTRSELVDRYFEIYESNQIVLKQGELKKFDIRQYSLPLNLEIISSLLNKIEKQIDKMASQGFYVTIQRKAVASASRFLSESFYYYEEGHYVESFKAGKLGFIEITLVQRELTSMLKDASISVYIIITLFALSSCTISFLIFNNYFSKILFNVVFYFFSISILYYTYPGSVIIPFKVFVETSIISIIIVLILAIIIPMFPRGNVSKGHIPIRNMIVPIFSIAKRSISKRKLRFVFTLFSITTLVISFVILTSYSEGYGLVEKKYSNPNVSVQGILLRAQGYSKSDPIFLSFNDAYSGWLDRQNESTIVSYKIENKPQFNPILILRDQPILGLVGVDFQSEAKILGLDLLLLEGKLPSEDGFAISEKLRNKIDVKLGDQFNVSGVLLELEGIFNDKAIENLRDIDGSFYLPDKIININHDSEEPIFTRQICNPSEVIFININKAVKISFTGISRVDILVDEDVDTKIFADRLALERGYWVWSSKENEIHHVKLGSYFEGKGLSLIVPWSIVVLIVMITITNSIYERRNEIKILSSIGLNPSQITSIFIAEAIILGLISGGLGYLTGMTLYKIMTIFKITLEVQQKISAFWNLASIAIAMTAVLVGAFFALKQSVIITPSLSRTWEMGTKKVDFLEPWEIFIPIKIRPDETRAFFYYMVNELKLLEDHTVMATSFIKVIDEEGKPFEVNFIYQATQMSVGNFYTKNTLIVDKESIDSDVSVRLLSYGQQDWSHETGSLIRLIAMRWSTNQR
jgi:ABC-type antimicrobial peptide transport system permease subunit